MGTLAYQLLHTLRSVALTGSWRRAQPKRLRLWLFRLPGKLTDHARKSYLQLLKHDPDGRSSSPPSVASAAGCPHPFRSGPEPSPTRSQEGRYAAVVVPVCP